MNTEEIIIEEEIITQAPKLQSSLSSPKLQSSLSSHKLQSSLSSQASRSSPKLQSSTPNSLLKNSLIEQIYELNNLIELIIIYHLIDDKSIDKSIDKIMEYLNLSLYKTKDFNDLILKIKKRFIIQFLYTKNKNKNKTNRKIKKGVKEHRGGEECYEATFEG